MAYYLSDVDTRFLDVLEKLQLYQSDALEKIWKERSCSVYEICFYIACINPKVYGDYFAISRTLPTPDIVKNIASLLEESKKLRPKLLMEMKERIRAHFNLIYTYVQDGKYLFTTSTPFTEDNTFYLKNGLPKKKPTRELIKKMCRKKCKEEKGRCFDTCSASLMRHFRIEIALQEPHTTKRTMFDVKYTGVDVEIV